MIISSVSLTVCKAKIFVSRTLSTRHFYCLWFSLFCFRLKSSMLNKTGTHVFWENGVDYPRISAGAHPLARGLWVRDCMGTHIVPYTLYVTYLLSLLRRLDSLVWLGVLCLLEGACLGCLLELCFLRVLRLLEVLEVLRLLEVHCLLEVL